MQLKAVADSFLSALYPADCLHCQQSVEGEGPLCLPCSQHLTLLQRQLVCPRCCSERFCSGQCEDCAGQAPYKHLAAFSHYGPVVDVLSSFKYGNRPALGKSLAAYLFLQTQAFDFPECDLITFVPQTRLRTWMRGYNQAQILAEELGKLSQRPVLSLLGRRGERFAQANLSRTQRRESADEFYALEKDWVEDKVLWIVDDVFTTGATLTACGDACQDLFPRRVLTLSVSRA